MDSSSSSTTSTSSTSSRVVTKSCIYGTFKGAFWSSSKIFFSVKVLVSAAKGGNNIMNATFVHELERLVVAQICYCFEAVNLAAADALAEVLSRRGFSFEQFLLYFRALVLLLPTPRFLLEVGHTSHRIAELAVRPFAISLPRVISSEIESLGSAFSRVVHNAELFEVPFAHTLPLRLQTRRLPKRAPAFRELGDPALPHFPKFLPALPDEHTFNRTPGEISKAPNDLKASISSGHKPFEDAFRSLKRANDMCKRKKFGEYEANPRVDDIVLKQYDLWQASFSDQEKQSETAKKLKSTSGAPSDFHWDGDVDGALNSVIKISREKVEFDLDFRAKAKTSKACQSNQLQSTNAPFREHSTFTNADFETVDKLVKGHVSVFESS